MAEKQTFKCDQCNEEFKTNQALLSHIRSKHPDGGTALVARGQPLDLAVSRLQVPAVPEEYNGQATIYWAGFNKGVRYGADTILAGIRAAQDLSSLGIAQATPIIKMAQEMRQAEGQAAQALASEFAQAVQGSNQTILEALHNLNLSQQAGSTNPMQRMVAMIQSIPQMMNAMNSLTGMFGLKPVAGQQPQGQPAGQTQQQPPQPAPVATAPQPATEKDIEEAFGDV